MGGILNPSQTPHHTYYIHQVSTHHHNNFSLPTLCPRREGKKSDISFTPPIERGKKDAEENKSRKKKRRKREKIKKEEEKRETE